MGASNSSEQHRVSLAMRFRRKALYYGALYYKGWWSLSFDELAPEEATDAVHEQFSFKHYRSRGNLKDEINKRLTRLSLWKGYKINTYKVLGLKEVPGGVDVTIQPCWSKNHPCDLPLAVLS